MYVVVPQPVMDNWATRTQLYQVISVEPERIAYRAHNAIGDVHDSVRLENTAEGGTRLVNEVERPVGL